MGEGDTRRRDDPKARWNKPHKPRGRKDRRRWCRGKEGVEHVPEMERVGYFRDLPCSWHRWSHRVPWRFWCHHMWVCTNCGKHLEYINSEDCPDRTERPK